MLTGSLRGSRTELPEPGRTPYLRCPSPMRAVSAAITMSQHKLQAARDGNAIHRGNDVLRHAFDPQEKIHRSAQLLGKLAVLPALQAFEKPLEIVDAQPSHRHVWQTTKPQGRQWQSIYVEIVRPMGVCKWRHSGF